MSSPSVTLPCTTAQRASVPSSCNAEHWHLVALEHDHVHAGVEQRLAQPAAQQPVGPGDERVPHAQSFQGAPPSPHRSLSCDRVLVGVHALPEARVPVGAQVAVGGQALERLALEHAGAIQVVEHAGLEAEEAAVDPVLGARLLVKARRPRRRRRAR